MKSLILVCSLLVSCGVAGKDGKDGTGAVGERGKDGTVGVTGKDGKNGIDNRFINSINCSGKLVRPGSIWDGYDVTYTRHNLSSGDVVANAWIRIGSFTQSSAAAYSSIQNGAETGAVFIPLDNTSTLVMSVNLTTKISTAEFFGSNPEKFSMKATDCRIVNF